MVLPTECYIPPEHRAIMRIIHKRAAILIAIFVISLVVAILADMGN